MRIPSLTAKLLVAVALTSVTAGAFAAPVRHHRHHHRHHHVVHHAHHVAPHMVRR